MKMMRLGPITEVEVFRERWCPDHKKMVKTHLVPNGPHAQELCSLNGHHMEFPPKTQDVRAYLKRREERMKRPKNKPLDGSKADASNGCPTEREEQ